MNRVSAVYFSGTSGFRVGPRGFRNPPGGAERSIGSGNLGETRISEKKEINRGNAETRRRNTKRRKPAKAECRSSSCLFLLPALRALKWVDKRSQLRRTQAPLRRRQCWATAWLLGARSRFFFFSSPRLRVSAVYFSCFLANPHLKPFPPQEGSGRPLVLASLGVCAAEGSP